jgi:uncharacterized membrane protein YdjX (TVP38/TMEM64 family)
MLKLAYTQATMTFIWDFYFFRFFVRDFNEKFDRKHKYDMLVRYCIRDINDGG